MHNIQEPLSVRNHLDLNEHERLFNLRHTLTLRNNVFIDVVHSTVTARSRSRWYVLFYSNVLIYGMNSLKISKG